MSPRWQRLEHDEQNDLCGFGFPIQLGSIWLQFIWLAVGSTRDSVGLSEFVQQLPGWRSALSLEDRRSAGKRSPHPRCRQMLVCSRHLKRSMLPIPRCVTELYAHGLGIFIRTPGLELRKAVLAAQDGHSVPGTFE